MLYNIDLTHTSIESTTFASSKKEGNKAASHPEPPRAARTAVQAQHTEREPPARGTHTMFNTKGKRIMTITTSIAFAIVAIAAIVSNASVFMGNAD